MTDHFVDANKIVPTKADIERAIEYFEAVKRNNGADSMVHFGPVAQVEMVRQYRLANTALHALRELLGGQGPCMYCREKSPRYLYRRDNQVIDYMIGMVGRMRVEGTEIFLSAPTAGSCVGSSTLRVDINYCPMCGRALSKTGIVDKDIDAPTKNEEVPDGD